MKMNHYKDQNGKVHALSDEDILNGGERFLPPGCVRISDKEAVQLQVLSTEDLAKQIRLERDAKLNGVMWMVHRHDQQDRADLKCDLSDEEFIALLRYIQELRDVPAQKGFPAKVKWPKQPAFIKQ